MKPDAFARGMALAEKFIQSDPWMASRQPVDNAFLANDQQNLYMLFVRLTRNPVDSRTYDTARECFDDDNVEVTLDTI